VALVAADVSRATSLFGGARVRDTVQMSWGPAALHGIDRPGKPTVSSDLRPAVRELPKPGFLLAFKAHGQAAFELGGWWQPTDASKPG